MKVPAVLNRNKVRYLSLIAGFLLFVAPFALLARGVNLLNGSLAEPILCMFCNRLPFESLVTGQFVALLGSVAAAFVLGVIVIAFFFGPVFCGWLCPAGAVSEGISRAVPLSRRFRLRVDDPAVTKAMRYGFLAGFAAVSILVASKLGPINSITHQYCSYSVLQMLADGLTGQVASVSYWNTGTILTLFSWLIIGGVFMAGGRGWCLFFCPLGAVSSLSHTLGKKLGMYRVSFMQEKCVNCKTCQVACPMWATGQDRAPDSSLCITCNECVTACPRHCYTYQIGGST